MSMAFETFRWTTGTSVPLARLPQRALDPMHPARDCGVRTGRHLPAEPAILDDAATSAHDRTFPDQPIYITPPAHQVGLGEESPH